MSFSIPKEDRDVTPSFSIPKQDIEPSGGFSLPESDRDPAPSAPAAPSSILRRGLADPLVAAAKGIVGLPEGIVGLADIPTLGRAGKLAESAGIKFGETKDILDTMLSPEARAARGRVSEGFKRGIVPGVAEIVSNPSTIVQGAIESLPGMLGGGAVARGVVGRVPSLKRAVEAGTAVGATPAAVDSARRAFAIGGGIGEGLVTAGQNTEQVRREAEGGVLTPKQAALQAASGAITGVLGYTGGKLATSMGFADPDTLLAGGMSAAKSRIMAILGGIISEGALEELPQSIQEQVFQNISLGKPWSEGVAESGAMGAIIGGIMGAGANLRSFDKPRMAGIAPAATMPQAPSAPEAMPTPGPAPVVPPQPEIEPVPATRMPTPEDMRLNRERWFAAEVEKRRAANREAWFADAARKALAAIGVPNPTPAARKVMAYQIRNHAETGEPIDHQAIADANQAPHDAGALADAIAEQLPSLAAGAPTSNAAVAPTASTGARAEPSVTAGRPTGKAERSYRSEVGSIPTPATISPPEPANQPTQQPRADATALAEAAAGSPISAGAEVAPTQPPPAREAVSGQQAGQHGQPDGRAGESLTKAPMKKGGGISLPPELMTPKEYVRSIVDEGPYAKEYAEEPEIADSRRKSALQEYGSKIDKHIAGGGTVSLEQADAIYEAFGDARAHQILRPALAGGRINGGEYLPPSSRDSTKSYRQYLASFNKDAVRPRNVAELYRLMMKRAASNRYPLSVEGVEDAKMDVPPGYVREGDRYVYKPTSKAAELKAKVKKGAKHAGGIEGAVAVGEQPGGAEGARGAGTAGVERVEPGAPAARAEEQAPGVAGEGQREAVKEPWQMTRAQYIASGENQSVGQHEAQIRADALQRLESANAGLKRSRESGNQRQIARAQRFVAIAEEEADAAVTGRWTENQRVRLKLQGEQSAMRAHAAWVKDALREGKPVPPEVLAEYPDLKATPEPPAPPPTPIAALKEKVRRKRAAASTSKDRIIDKVYELGGLRYYAVDPETGKRPMQEEMRRLIRYLRPNGMPLDRMVESLRMDPETAGIAADWTEHDLYEYLTTHRPRQMTAAEYERRTIPTTPEDYAGMALNEKTHTVNEAEIDPDALVVIGEEIFKAKRTPEGKLLQDGADIPLQDFDNIEARAVVSKGDPAYPVLLNQYKAQEKAKAAKTDTSVAPSETPSTFTLEAQTPADVEAGRAEKAKAAAKAKMEAEAARPLVGKEIDTTGSLLPDVEPDNPLFAAKPAPPKQAAKEPSGESAPQRQIDSWSLMQESIAALDGRIGYIEVKRDMGNGRYQLEAYGLDGNMLTSGKTYGGPDSVSGKLSRRKDRYWRVATATYDIPAGQVFSMEWLRGEMARFDEQIKRHIAEADARVEQTPAAAPATAQRQEPSSATPASRSAAEVLDRYPRVKIAPNTEADSSHIRVTPANPKYNPIVKTIAELNKSNDVQGIGADAKVEYGKVIGGKFVADPGEVRVEEAKKLTQAERLAELNARRKNMASSAAVQIIEGGPATYNGRKRLEFEREFPGRQAGADRVTATIEQYEKGGNTYYVDATYYNTPEGEKYPRLQRDRIASNLSLKDAKEAARAWLRTVQDVEAGGKPILTPSNAPQGPQVSEPEPGEQIPDESIQDFGEKIGGARKDMAPSVSREISDDDLATMSFSEIWPKAEVDAIEDNDMAALATALRNEVPAKPRKGYKVARWVERVKVVRSLMRHANEQGFDAIMQRMRSGEYARTLAGFADKVNLLRQLPREHWDRIGKVENHPDAYRYEGKTPDGKPNRVPSPHSTAVVDDRWISADSLDALPAAVMERLGVPVEVAAMQFEIRGKRDGSEMQINKKGDPLYRPLKKFTGPDAVAQARAFIKDNRTDLVAAWEAVKESDNVKETDVRRETNRPRTAKDYRQGRDVTPEMFTDAFGFRGVEFGNWVAQGISQRERQGMLNEAFDALSDLADIIGVPPQALSLNGELALGFGSRGHGWASAHYEPGKVVINLTKTRGAGTLAHEWFHALDHYFQRQRKGVPSKIPHGGEMITFQPEGYYEHGPTGQRLSATRFAEINGRGGIRNPSEWKRIEGIRPEVEEAFVDLVKALDNSPMRKRSALIDKGKSGGYWSRVIERAARAFENYVIYKMAQKGYQNDYLANVAKLEEFKRDAGRYPYLLDAEIEPVAKEFDDLFSTVKTRETDKGVAMFARSGGFYSALQRAVESLPDDAFTPEPGRTVKGRVTPGRTITDKAGNVLKTIPERTEPDKVYPARGVWDKLLDIRDEKYKDKDGKERTRTVMGGLLGKPEHEVRVQEAEESQFSDWLKMQEENGKLVTKAAALAFLEGNGVRIETVRKGYVNQRENRAALRAAFDEKLRIEAEAQAYTDRGEDAPQELIDAHVAAGDRIARLEQARQLGSDTKFSEHAPLGGVPGSYREIVLTVPGTQPKDIGQPGSTQVWLKPPSTSALRGTMWQGQEPDTRGFVMDATSSTPELAEGTAQAYRENPDLAGWEIETRHVGRQTYQMPRYESPHWSEDNPIAHMLVDERRIPLDVLEKTQPELAARLRAQGKTEARALNMIEGQSDIHQEGAAKGYQSQQRIAGVDAARERRRAEIQHRLDAIEAENPTDLRRRYEVSIRHAGYKGQYPFGTLDEVRDNTPAGGPRDEALHLRERLDSLLAEREMLRNELRNTDHGAMEDKVPNTLVVGMPALPMRGDAWKRLVVRKMLAEAVDGDYDLLTWSTGADRFKKWGSQRVDWKEEDRATIESIGDKWRVVVGAREIASNIKPEIYRTREDAEAGARDYNDATEAGQPRFPAWTVSAQEQSGGEHQGQNIEALARERGVLLEQHGQTVRTKEDLRRVIESIKRGDDTNVEKLTDRIWERMQTEPEGTSLPRKEFFEFLYDTSFRNEANDILKKMGEKAGVSETAWYTTNVPKGYGDEYLSGDVHAIPITDNVKAAVAKGQPYYARAATESDTTVPRIAEARRQFDEKQRNAKVEGTPESQAATENEDALRQRWGAIPGGVRRQRQVRSLADQVPDRTKFDAARSDEPARLTQRGKALIARGKRQGLADVVLMRGVDRRIAGTHFGGVGFVNLDANVDHVRIVDHEAAHESYRDAGSPLRAIGNAVDVESEAAEAFRNGYYADTGMRLTDAQLREEMAVEIAMGNVMHDGVNLMDAVRDRDAAASNVEAYYGAEPSRAGPGAADESRFAAAWHGSPHTFERFDTGKIGTGEGAQAYGHGLYFAGRREVAEYYRTAASHLPAKVRSRVTYKGLDVTDLTPREMMRDMRLSEPDATALAWLSYETSIDDAIAKWSAKIGQEPRPVSLSSQAIAALKGLQKDITMQPVGRLYSVDLAPAEDEYLLWDRPLSEQSEKVKKALRDAGLYADIEAEGHGFRIEPTPSGKSFKVVDGQYEYGTYRSMEDANAKLASLQKNYAATGQTIYYDVGRHVHRGADGKLRVSDTLGANSAQWSSEFLASIGIPGIKYLDEGSRSFSITPIDELNRSTLDRKGRYQVVDTAENKRVGVFTTERDAQQYVYDHASYNYVIFSDKDVTIKARFARGESQQGNAEQQWRNYADEHREEWDSLIAIAQRLGGHQENSGRQVSRQITAAPDIEGTATITAAIEALRKSGRVLVPVRGMTARGFTEPGGSVFVNVEQSKDAIDETVRHETFHALADAGDNDARTLLGSVNLRSPEYAAARAKWMRDHHDRLAAVESEIVKRMGLSSYDSASPEQQLTIRRNVGAYVREELVADFVASGVNSRIFADSGVAGEAAGNIFPIRRYQEREGMSDAERALVTGAEGGASLQAARDKAAYASKAEAMKAKLQEKAEAAVDKAKAAGAAKVLKERGAIGEMLAQYDGGEAANRIAEGRMSLRAAVNALLRAKAEEQHAARKSILHAINKKLREVKVGRAWSTLVTLSAKNVTEPMRLAALQRIDAEAETFQKRALVAIIKAAYAKAADSKAINVLYRERIKALMDGILMTKPTEATLAKAREMAEFLEADRADTDTAQVEIDRKTAKLLRTLTGTPLADMGVSELEDLFQQIHYLTQTGRIYQQERDEAYQARQDADKADLAAGTTPMNDAPQADAFPGKDIGVRDWLRNKLGAVSDAMRNWYVYHQPIDVVFDMLDGAKHYAGVNYRIFKARIDNAFSAFRAAMHPYSDTDGELHAIVKRLGIGKKEAERIGVYAIDQQATGRQKLLNNYSDGTPEDDARVNREIDAIQLTDNEMEFYRWMRARLDGIRPQIDGVMREVYNAELDKVENYFPFITDWSLMDRTIDIYGLTIDPETGAWVKTDVGHGGKRKNVTQGFTKVRTGAGNQTVRVDAINAFHKHMQDVNYYIHVGPTVKYLQEIASSDEYRAIAGKFGQKIVTDYLDTMARQGGMGGAHILRLVDALRNNVGIGTLGFRLSSILIQPTSWFDGAGMIGGRWAMKGAMNVTQKEWRDFMWKNMTEIHDRIGDDWAFGEAVLKSKLARYGFMPLQWLDEVTAGSIAAGAYEKNLHERGLAVDFANPDAEALAYAQKMVRRTQASPSYKDQPLAVTRGALMGGSRTLARLIYQFQTFSLNKFSYLTHDGLAAAVRNKEPTAAAAILMWTMFAFMAEEGVRYMLRRAPGGGGNEDEDAEEYWKRVFANYVQVVPWLGSAVSSLTYNSFPAPAIAAVADVGMGAKAALTAKTPEAQLKGKIRAGGAALTMAGIPGSSQAAQWWRNSIQTDSEWIHDAITESAHRLPRTAGDGLIRLKALQVYNKMKREGKLPPGVTPAQFRSRYHAVFKNLNP